MTMLSNIYHQKKTVKEMLQNVLAFKAQFQMQKGSSKLCSVCVNTGALSIVCIAVARLRVPLSR